MEEDPSEPKACPHLPVNKKLSQPSKEPLDQHFPRDNGSLLQTRVNNGRNTHLRKAFMVREKTFETFKDS